MKKGKSQSVAAAEFDPRHQHPVLCLAVQTNPVRGAGTVGVGVLVLVVSLFLNSTSSFAWQKLAAISNPLPSFLPTSKEAAAKTILELIDLLDCPAFARRQSATDALIEYGGEALPDLSRRFFEGSPETNYRIRKALEGIAAAGDERTFLKSSAILLTLYSNGNDHIFKQIEELKEKWQAQRTESAIEALKRTGAEVSQQNGYNARFARRTVTVRALGGVNAADAEKVKFVKRTISQQKEMVDKILASDVDANRDFIFELMPNRAPAASTPNASGLNLNVPLLAGTQIKFPADWAEKNTDASALKELLFIKGRLFVELADSNLSDAQWKQLTAADNISSLNLATKEENAQVPSTLPGSIESLGLTGFEIGADFAPSLRRSPQLQQIQFNNCDFDQQAARSVDAIESIKNVVCQFENQKLDTETVIAMAEFDDLRAVHFTAVEFSDAALQSLRRLAHVSLLYINEMPATSQFFQNVGAMPRLNSIQFKGCKLNIPAYKKLAAAQRVRMSFEAQAFLGIQGSGALNGRSMSYEAVVSMVVPDSAAEEGGIKAGDRISKIDGEKVEDFDDVRLHITQYSAGDEVEIEVMRDGKPEALKVKLRDYKTARKF